MPVQTHLGIGEIVERSSVRGRSQVRVAGRGFSVWLDAKDVRTAAGAFENDLASETVNESNSTTLPYNPDPQVEGILDTQSTIVPGDYEIDPDERLHPSDSLSFDSRSEDTQPAPNPDLFAKGAAVDYPEVGEQDEPPICSCGKHYVTPGFTHKDWAAQRRGSLRHAGPELVLPVADEALPEVLPPILGQGDDEEEDPRADTSFGGDHSDLIQHGIDESPLGPIVEPLQKVLGSKYATWMLDAHVDHYNDPIQRFRDDPSGEIQRLGHLMSDTLDEETQRYGMLIEADQEMRTAAWFDVRAKASRLREAGAVHVLDYSPGQIYASVDGDHGTYDVMLKRGNEYSGDNKVSDWNCHCFLPDAPVMMADGTERPIAELRPGDEVITHTGQVRRVVEIRPKPFSGEIARVKTNGSYREFVATSEHRVYSALADRAPAGDGGWAEVGTLRVGDYLSQSIMSDEQPLVVSVPRRPGHTTTNKYGTRGISLHPGHHGGERWTFTYKDGGRQGRPRTAYFHTREEAVAASDRHHAERAVEDVKIDSDLAYWLGWYAAEGCLVKNPGGYRVAFALADHEGWVADQLDEISWSHFGVRGTRRHLADKGVIDYRVSNHTLYRLAELLVGTGSHDKKLAREMLVLPADERQRFLAGWLYGDGAVGKNGQHTISTVSQTLAHQAREMLVRDGWKVGICRRDSNSGGLPTTQNAGPIYQVRWMTRANNAYQFERDGVVFHRITSIDLEPYKGEVWDIEVEDDHSFRAFGFNAHNCGWGKWAFRRQYKYVGRLCSHALAALDEMQSRDHQGNPGKFQRLRLASKITDEFSSWAKDNGIDIDIESVSDFLLEHPDLSDDEVEDLYEYVTDNPTRREVRDYTDPLGEGWPETLTTQPKRLTPSLVFPAEDGEGHRHEVVDVAKDERKTTGPGQIMHSSNRHLVAADDNDPFGGSIRGFPSNLDGSVGVATPHDQSSPARGSIDTSPLALGIDGSAGVATGPKAAPSSPTGGREPGWGGGAPLAATPATQAPANDRGGWLGGGNSATPDASGASSPGAAPSTPSVGGGAASGGGGWTANDIAAGSIPTGQDYTIKPGDTLSEIAQGAGYGDNYQALFDQNKDSLTDPNKINAGDKLHIPGLDIPAAGAGNANATSGDVGAAAGGAPTGGTDTGVGATPPPTPEVPGGTPSVSVSPLTADNPSGMPALGAPDTSLTGLNPTGDLTNPGLTPKVSRYLYAEDFEVDPLDELRDISGERDLGNAEAHNDHVRKLVDELHDDYRMDASQMVAALEVEGDPHQGFTGSGSNPKYVWGTSQEYVDKNEKPHRVDVTDLDDNDMIRYTEKEAATDVVRRFQADLQREGSAIDGESSGGQYSDDAIASRADAMIRTAGRKFTLAEQRALEDEEHPLGARNAPTAEDLRGTHYVD